MTRSCWGSKTQHLVGLMRLFAPPDLVGGAEAVLKGIVEVLLKPSIELRQLARDACPRAPIPTHS